MNIFIIAKYGNKINVIYFFIFPLSKRIRGCRHNTRLTYNRSMSGSIEAGVSLFIDDNVYRTEQYTVYYFQLYIQVDFSSE